MGRTDSNISDFPLAQSTARLKVNYIIGFNKKAPILLNRGFLMAPICL